MANHETGLFNALEQALQAATTPLDCRQLFEMEEIKAHAGSVSRVSDYLGNLWRKNQVERLAEPEKKYGHSRWLYRWKGDRAPSPDAILYTPRVIADRPSMLITEEANVMTIEMPHLLISIRQKPKVSSYLEGRVNLFYSQFRHSREGGNPECTRMWSVISSPFGSSDLGALRRYKSLMWHGHTARFAPSSLSDLKV